MASASQRVARAQPSPAVDLRPAWLVVAMHVHLPGLPCGATAGRHGAGWRGITCPECIALVQACPEPAQVPT